MDNSLTRSLARSLTPSLARPPVRSLVKEELALTEKMGTVQEHITKRAEENALKNKEVNGLENQYRVIKLELEQEVASAMAQVEGLASEVATIRGACDAGLLDSEDRLAQVMSDQVRDWRAGRFSGGVSGRRCTPARHPFS